MMLDIEDLKTYFYTRRGVVKAVDGVTMSVERGELIAVVGESGCGKSTLAYSILRLIDPPGEIVGGRIIFDGVEITSLGEDELRRLRGRKIGMIFQDPMTSLDPLEKVGDQIAEAIMEHEKVSKKEALQMAAEALERVGIPPDRVNYYPHQLSGGQRQRVMIALALSLNPKMLIADEPTTALDVVVQEKIMDLLEEMRREGRAVMLITHDFALAAERSNRIAVMYAGWLVEMGKTESIVDEPLHPYTAGLIASVPDVWLDKEIRTIPGTPPDLVNPPEGCRFRPRCPKASEICKKEPPTFEFEDRIAKCWMYGDADAQG